MSPAFAPIPPGSRPIHAWIWITLATSVLICAALTAMHLMQERALVQASEIIREFRQARVDLFGGLLHVTQGDAENNAWNASQGRALLEQSLDAFENTLAGLPGDTEHATQFTAALQAFRAQLPARGQPLKPSLRQSVELRSAVHRLDTLARRIDTDARAGLLAIQTRQRRLFQIVLVSAAALLAVICGGMVRAARREAALEAGRAAAMRQTQAGYARFEKVFDASPAATSITTLAEGRILAVNNAYCRLYGHAREALIGHRLDELGICAEPDDRIVLPRQPHEPARISGRELKFRTRTGEVRDVLLSAEPIEFFGQSCQLEILTDITERKRYEARIEYLATHDDLTGLPNRNLIHDRIDQAIGYARRSDSLIAVVHLDLDRFKVINDGFGHSFGDELLKGVAIRLADTIPAGGTLARQSGDEFLILLADLERDTDAFVATERIQQAFERPFPMDGRELYVTASLGVSLYPQDGDSPDALIRNANVAMHRAKTLGRDTCQFFTQEMSAASRRLVELETQLRLALQQAQLHLVYPPKVSLESGRINGCEALLRWTHPELGAVSPAQFIPIAEESGLIVPIGNWVLRGACARNKAWIDAGLPPIVMSVNLSARQFLQQDIVAWVLDVLRDTGLPPGLLELELTESLIAQDVETAIATVGRLKAAGVRLSIDDFGTGYSSLSQLKRFRVDTLKIDQSFVRNMLADPDDATIVQAVVSLARSLRMSSVAEGVETPEQCRLLRAHQCDEIQGYHFSRPLAAADFEALLHSDRRLSL